MEVAPSRSHAASRPTVLRRWRAVVLCLGLLGMGGCAAPGASLSSEDRSDALQTMRSGQVVLDCGFLCSAGFIFRQHEFADLYRAQEWSRLGIATMKVRWRQDLTYFYLGAAAEGLQYFDAADRYYRMAGALATGNDPTAKCSSVQDLCSGFVFPRDIATRLRVVAQARRAQAASTLADARLAPTIHPTSAALSSDGAPTGDFVADAPQSLLAWYARARLAGQYTGSPAREASFADQLLDVFNPTVAQQTRGNEIARPREVRAVREKLSRVQLPAHLVLGFFVQLRDYDLRSHSFAIRYPEHYSANQLVLNSSIFRGASQRQAGVRGYSVDSTPCIWEPGNDYPRPDLGDGFFVMMNVCVQHPPANATVTVLTGNANEIPPFVFLQPLRGSLWARLPMDERDAEALIQRIGTSRYVWSELVFDVSKIQAGYGGPYGAREVYASKQPGLVISILPKALFLWETPAGPRPRVMAALGDVRNVEQAAKGRILLSMIAERETPPAVSSSAVPVAPSSAAPSKPAASAAASTSAVPAPDAEAWIDPPPAKPK